MKARRGCRRPAPRKPDDGVCKALSVDEAKVAAVRAAMPAPDEIEGITDLFAVLSNVTRVRLLYALTREELCVCDLACVVERSMPAVSHQLQLLRRMRVVKYRMAGKLAYYSLVDANHSRNVVQLIAGGIHATATEG